MDYLSLLRIAASAALSASAALAHAAPSGCESAAANTSALEDRRATIAAMQEMPEGCLKHIVLECQQAMEQSVLDFGSAAACSMGYEALLAKSFGENFQSLLAWWRSERANSAVQ